MYIKSILEWLDYILLYTFSFLEITHKDACAMIGPGASKYHMEHVHTPMG